MPCLSLARFSDLEIVAVEAGNGRNLSGLDLTVLFVPVSSDEQLARPPKNMAVNPAIRGRVNVMDVVGAVAACGVTVTPLKNNLQYGVMMATTEDALSGAGLIHRKWPANKHFPVNSRRKKTQITT